MYSSPQHSPFPLFFSLSACVDMTITTKMRRTYIEYDEEREGEEDDDEEEGGGGGD